jgi:nucleoside-diphosphate-sugar epimerase
MKKKVLVTGAGGYIGSILVPSLIKSGYSILAIDRFFFGNYLKKNNNLEIIYEDIRSIKSKYFKGIYAVIDLAAISNDPSGEKFRKETFEINYKARVRNAKLAKKNNVTKYLLPSSCSNYGRIGVKEIADENFKLNPLTNYSKANAKAEKEILKLSSTKFCATVFRQGTLFGFSPRMRLDIAINGMTYGIYKENKLPVMRDGKQRRPMLHIKDCVRAIKFFIAGDNKNFSGEVFNIGGKQNNYSINDLILIYKKIFKNNFKLIWYGSPDNRSYFVSFDKIKKMGFSTLYDAEYGINELYKIYKKKNIEKTSLNVTLEWYSELEKWNSIIDKCGVNSKIIKNYL